MFYSFVDVQLNVFLFSQILQGHVQQALSPSSFWLMRKVNHKLVGKKNKKPKREKCRMSKCPGSLPQVQTPRRFHDALVMPLMAGHPAKVTCDLYSIWNLKVTWRPGYSRNWVSARVRSCNQDTLELSFLHSLCYRPQGHMRHGRHHLKHSFWARAPPSPRCIRRLSCREITNTISRCWVNKYSCWSGVLQFLETSTFGPQEAFQLPGLQIDPWLLLSKPIPRVLQIRVFLLSQRKNESGVLFSLCLEESVIIQVTIFNIDILT